MQGCTSGGHGGNGGANFVATRSVVLDSVAIDNGQEGFKSNNLSLGRSVAHGNLGGDVSGVKSLGGDLANSKVF